MKKGRHDRLASHTFRLCPSLPGLTTSGEDFHPPRGPAMSPDCQPGRREFLRAAAATLAAVGSRGPAMADDKPLRIIDPHVHVWKNDPKYPWPKDLWDPPKEDALPETLLGL